MKIFLSLLALFLLGSQATVGKYTEIAGLPPLPDYSVETVTEKIAVDGTLSEKAWRRARPIVLLFPWEDQTGAKQRTTVKLLRDAEFLYVAYECEDEDLTAVFEKRDDPVYKDDCVEIFLKPSEKTDSYIGLEMNARGVLFDYFYPYPGKNEYGFNLEGVQLQTTMRGTLNQSGDRDAGWSLELAIPWASLRALAPAAPGRNEAWRAQINRWDGTEPRRRLSMWCASGMKRPNPHNPERFGTLRFR